MSEKLVYADLNLTESTRPKLQKVTDVQGSFLCYFCLVLDSTYAETKGSFSSCSPNLYFFFCLSVGKSCCSRTRVAVLVAVIILLLVLAVCLILMCKSCILYGVMVVVKDVQKSPDNVWQNGQIFKTEIAFLFPDHPTASRPSDSKTFSTTCEDAHTVSRSLFDCCPKHWEKNGGKCYFFSQMQKENNWNDSRKECTDMNADLVIIDNKDELNFLYKRSRSNYYLLGLTYSQSERKWKWINNVELSTDMFCIGGDFTDYFCTVIGHGKVETAPCSGAFTTQSMCEKAADISERQKES
uniref:C-type lectin domain-containing protein n=1 Tax=Strigops habroptila TaxID=2489341 RepID=A0A672UT71_STRHB